MSEEEQEKLYDLLFKDTKNKLEATIEKLRIVNAELRDAISEGKNGSELRRYLAKTGFTSMIENGRDLVRQGETTPEELLKVIPTIE